MEITPIDSISKSGFDLKPDILGNMAYKALSTALNISDIILTNYNFVIQNANLLALTGAKIKLPGSKDKEANGDVRLYIFEVPTIFDSTERHCIMLISNIPTDYKVESLWSFCANNHQSAVNNFLISPTIENGMVLLSTLDYNNPAYKYPPFPPDNDSLTGEEQSFIKSINGFITRGYTFEMATSLEENTGKTGTSVLHDALTLLSVTSVFSDQTFLSQVKLTSTGADLILDLQLDIKKSFTLSKISFQFDFESIGLSFPLQVTSFVVPSVLLNGKITLDTLSLDIEADINPVTKYLTFTVDHIPDFEHFIQHFNFHNSDFLDSKIFTDVGTITLEEVSIGINLDPFSLNNITLIITTEKYISLIGDIVKLQPTVIAQVDDPFSDNRLFNIEIYGRWIIENADIETVLDINSNGYQIIAQLALGQTLSISHLMRDIFRGQIKGIPDLSISGFEFIGIKSGEDTNYRVELDIQADWRLGILPLTLDNINMEVAYANSELTEAGITSNLTFSGVDFRLSALYNPDNKGWKFSGGITSGKGFKVVSFIGKLASELGVNSHNGFLEPFEQIDITKLYLEYYTFQGQSSQFALYMSLTDSDKANFGVFNFLKNILISFQTNGSATKWRFDASAGKSEQKPVSSMVSYINSKHNTDVKLPDSMANLSIEELGAYHDSALGNYGFTLSLTLGSSSKVYLQIDLIKQFDDNSKKPDYEKFVKGLLVFNQGNADELDFDIELVSSSEMTDFVAYYQSENPKSLSLGSLIKAITDEDITSVKDLSIEIRNALFSFHKHGNTTKSIFAIDMDEGINLSGLGNLPLIGKELDKAETLTLAFQIVYATHDYHQAELKAINEALPKNAAFRFPETNITGASAGIHVELRLGSGESFGIHIPVGLNNDGTLKHNSNASTSSHQSDSVNPQPNTPVAPQPHVPAGSQPNAHAGSQPNPIETDKDGIKWFNIKKTFGPLHLNRVGFKYSNDYVTCYLDGALSLLGLTVDLMGLNVTTKITGTHKFYPSFGLDGLGIDFRNGPVEIGAAFYKEPVKLPTFDGLAIISMETIQLSAIGSFAEMADGHKSLFIYATIDLPLGGPVFFYITGLAAGFGYNRKLLLPKMTHLQAFPLIADAESPPSSLPADMSQIEGYISNKIIEMDQYIPPETGEYFLAAGISFTSFDLLNSFALVILQFGKHFEIDLLGISTLLVPPDVEKTPIAEAQLLLKASFIPSEGVVIVQAQLTNNSFIFSRDCHLTGGYAYAGWFKGPHSGNFVVTMGGYNPDFKAPSYYPRVPRVGFNWAIDSDLRVKGGGYYALVPHGIMAGGSLEAIFKTSIVKAWFILKADFMIMWKPFHYEIDFYINIGAEIIIHFFGTHHIGIDARANLHIWGPDFGGHAHVSISVIGIGFHFSIDFGAHPSPPPPIPWHEFRESFLPDDDKIVSITIEKGLERAGKAKGQTEKDEDQTVNDKKQTATDKNGNDLFVVNRKYLTIVTNSVVPVKSLGGTFPALQKAPASFGVSPMQVSDVDTSHHKVTIDGPAANELTCDVIPRSVPSALWGQTYGAKLNPEHSLIADTMAGIRIRPKAPPTSGPTLTVKRDQLMYDTISKKGYQLSSMAGFQITQPNTKWERVQENILSPETVKTRTSLLTNMGFDPGRLNYSRPFNYDSIYAPQYGVMEGATK